ncbi:hypothetical protein BpHYR1_033911 [Brachionus plicatilis]|uniref:Uncharacterized protein n=1 Tax=Brachionus plicatilis TaxID=10195 RepID=A0A3M7P3W4_BRAPC|nr:hypothetical protein BpHYR1_033911 [Brachionus plicatilis]
MFIRQSNFIIKPQKPDFSCFRFIILSTTSVISSSYHKRCLLDLHHRQLYLMVVLLELVYFFLGHHVYDSVKLVNP